MTFLIFSSFRLQTRTHSSRHEKSYQISSSPGTSERLPVVVFVSCLGSKRLDVSEEVCMWMTRPVISSQKQTHFHLVSLGSNRHWENHQHAARRLRYCPRMLHETIGLIHGYQMSKQISLTDELLVFCCFFVNWWLSRSILWVWIWFSWKPDSASSVNNNQPRLLEKHACGNISAKYYIVLALFVTHSKWNELKEFSILYKVDEGRYV